MSTELFQVRPYAPDNAVSPKGLALLLMALSVVGALLGLIAYFIGQWFYLILLFPIAIGIGLGFVGGSVVEKAKIRNPFAVGVAGLLAGVFAMLVMHFAEFQSLKADVSEALTADPGLEEVLAIPDADWTALTTEWRNAEQGADVPAEEDIVGLTDARNVYSSVLGPNANLLTYMEMQAHEGVSIGRATSSGSGFNLGRVGSWIYWILEVLLVAGIAFFMLIETARQPFCPISDEWKAGQTLMVISTDKANAKRAVESGSMKDIADLPGGSFPVYFTLYPSTSDAPEAKCDVFLQAEPKKQGEALSTFAKFSYPNRAWGAFVELAKRLQPDPEPEPEIQST